MGDRACTSDCPSPRRRAHRLERGIKMPEVRRPEHELREQPGLRARPDAHGAALAVDLPAIEVCHLNTPNSLTPLGIKGMSEGGTMGAIGAVANAVNDAFAPLGILVDTQPLTAERIWRSLNRRD